MSERGESGRRAGHAGEVVTSSTADVKGKTAEFCITARDAELWL
jgi:hypothetical protein